MATASMPANMMTLWKTSVHTTALKPPWNTIEARSGGPRETPRPTIDTGPHFSPQSINKPYIVGQVYRDKLQYKDALYVYLYD